MPHLDLAGQGNRGIAGQACALVVPAGTRARPGGVVFSQYVAAALGTERDNSGEVGLGDAIGVADWPLDQLDPVAVRVGDPTGPRPVRAAGQSGRLGLDPPRGKIGEDRVQRLDLDHEVVEASAGFDRAFAGS